MQTIHSCVDNMDVTPTISVVVFEPTFLCIMFPPSEYRKKLQIFTIEENQLMELCPSFENCA